jgi:hypothetical protein
MPTPAKRPKLAAKKKKWSVTEELSLKQFFKLHFLTGFEKEASKFS